MYAALHLHEERLFVFQIHKTWAKTKHPYYIKAHPLQTNWLSSRKGLQNGHKSSLLFAATPNLQLPPDEENYL